MATIQHTCELTVVACWCGIPHAVPAELRRNQLRQHEDGRTVDPVYCPVGHKYYPLGQGRAALLEKQLKETQDRLARERASADQEKARLRDKVAVAENQTRAQKAAKTRIKNRIAKGVCPRCNRSFGIGALQKHLETKHPDFVVAE